MPENTTPMISPLEVLWRTLPDTARDIKLNMASLITFPPEVALSDAQRWGVALAAARHGDTLPFAENGGQG